MIIGIGIDLMEVDRVAKEFAKDIGLKEEIFSQSEIEYCEQKKFCVENYTAIYAAKEAFFKALGSGWRYGMRYKEVEIVNNESGKPELVVSGTAKQCAENAGVKKIHVSLSHIKGLAMAFVILEL